MDRTDPHYEAATQAGADELHRILCDDCSYGAEIANADRAGHEDDARAVIDAALPHIGGHIAAAIEAVAEGVTGSPTYRHVYIDALRRGASITRTVTQPHTTGPAGNPGAGTVVYPGTAGKHDPNPRT